MNQSRRELPRVSLGGLKQSNFPLWLSRSRDAIERATMKAEVIDSTEITVRIVDVGGDPPAL